MTTRPFQDETYKNAEASNTNSPVPLSSMSISAATSFPNAERTSCSRQASSQLCLPLWCHVSPYRASLALLRQSQLPPSGMRLPRRALLAAACFPAGDDFPCAAPAGAAFASAACDLDFSRPFDSPGAASFSPFRFFSCFSGFFGSSLMPARFFRILVRSSGVLPLPRNCISKNCSIILSNFGPRATPSASSSAAGDAMRSGRHFCK